MRIFRKPPRPRAGSSFIVRRGKLRRAVYLTLILALGLGSARTPHLPAAPADRVAAVAPTGLPPARLNKSAPAHARGRSNLRISLAGGREVPTAYEGPGELVQLLRENRARPLALAAADFDEDGVPDLICGYAGPGSGIVTLLRGNVDAIYPNAPEAQQRRAAGTYTDAPFLSPALVYAVPGSPDLLGAGDFDHDDHWDVVAATRGGDNLYLLSGDGRGGFAEPRPIDLPGSVTALAVGEVNRRDGLEDVAVGVDGADGPRVLVYEGPHGALRARPEVFGLPAAASGLALGQLDDHYAIDLAAAAGSELVIIHGRDRHAPPVGGEQAEGEPARISRHGLGSEVRAVTLGDFSGDQATEVALLAEDGAVRVLSREGHELTGRAHSAKELGQWHPAGRADFYNARATALVRAQVSGLGGDDLVAVDGTGRRLLIVSASRAGAADGSVPSTEYRRPPEAVSLGGEGEPVAVLAMRLSPDSLSDLVILRDGRSEPAVARTEPAATIFVNGTAGANDRDGVLTLREAILLANGDLPKNSLTPSEQAQVVGDPARNQLDAVHFKIPGAGPHTIESAAELPSITDRAVIDGSTQEGFAGGPVIDVGGRLVAFFPSITIRGLAVRRISLEYAGGHIVEGNFIGTDVGGGSFLGGGLSLTDSGNNLIGGTADAARNVIAGGISFGGFSGNNTVQGNYIGTDKDGTRALGNSGNGITIPTDRFGVTVGGGAPKAGNVISGNGGNGISISSSQGSPGGFLVRGNLIGTDKDGTSPLGNGVGVVLRGARSVVVEGNVISGNGTGVSIFPRAQFYTELMNSVRGNFIGTDKSGLSPLGNKGSGVTITLAPGNEISGNVISANGGYGIAVGSPPGDTGGTVGGGQIVVENNRLGTDKNGDRPAGKQLGNCLGGIIIYPVTIAVRLAGNNRDFVNCRGIVSRPGRST